METTIFSNGVLTNLKESAGYSGHKNQMVRFMEK